MRAVTSAGRGVEFGKQWEGQSVDGRFPLQRYLGGSRNAAVFLTQYQGSKAAIKLLRTSSQHAEVQQALWRKAAHLSHPHLVRIFEVGRCWLAGSELIFLVSEYAEENLAEVLPRRALSTAETEAVVRPALEVLRFLHHKGLVHARLRPSNVMSVSEQLKLSSDGIRPAGKLEFAIDKSTYDAPEVRDGTVSAASDVWSLGVTVAEILTQKIPAAPNDVQESASLPPPFADIVQHCLRQNPAQRWTVKEITDRLQVAESSYAPAVSATAPPARRSWRSAQFAIVAGVLIVLAGVYELVHRGSSPSAPPAKQPTSTASSPPASAPAQAQPQTPANSPGTVSNRVLPAPSVGARETIQGTVKVRVKVGVDTHGNVSSAKFVTEGPSKYFARLAMQAAQQWKFTPPTTNGQASPSEWTLLFEFTRGGVQALPEPAKAR